VVLDPNIIRAVDAIDAVSSWALLIPIVSDNRIHCEITKKSAETRIAKAIPHPIVISQKKPQRSSNGCEKTWTPMKLIEARRYMSDFDVNN
jgi:hypothetical protein